MSGRFLSFSRWRDSCVVLKARDNTTGYWMELDAARNGSISIFNFDADAVRLLAIIRARILAGVNCSENFTSDADVIFDRITSLVNSAKRDELSNAEWHALVRRFGVGQADADRAFTYLDMSTSASSSVRQGCVTVGDIRWLMRLSSVVEIDFVLMAPQEALSAGEQLLQRRAIPASNRPPSARAAQCHSYQARPRADDGTLSWDTGFWTDGEVLPQSDLSSLRGRHS